MKILALSLFLLATQSASAQYTWFPTGATWTYDVSWYIGQAIVKLEILPGDTLINNHITKKMMITTIVNGGEEDHDTMIEFRFVREEGNQVLGDNHLLYDFNHIVEDTLEYMYFGGLSPSPFIVDSVGVLEMNGMSLQFQDIRFPNLFDPDGEWWEMRVVEGIGSISTYFFWYHTVIQPFDAASYVLRCYEDSIIGTLHFDSQTDCDALPWTTAISETSTVESSIYPNPASSEIHIQLGKSTYESIGILDVHGRKLLQINTEGSTEIEANISQLPEGLYFVNGITTDGTLSNLGKFIK